MLMVYNIRDKLEFSLFQIGLNLIIVSKNNTEVSKTHAILKY